MTATLPSSFFLTSTAARHTPQPQVVAPRFTLAESAAGAVFHTVIADGPVPRERIAHTTGLSIATVNRQATALLGVGLLRERADLSTPGAIGRPRIPLEVNHEAFLVAGIHIGAVVTTIVASDIRGRILDGLHIRTPEGDQELALAAIGRSAAEFLGRSTIGNHGRWQRRTLLWAGVALGGRVDAHTGRADHPRLGWLKAPVGDTIGRALAVPVSVSPHVEAMAAAELLIAPRAGATPAGSSLYFYARETAGVALTIEGRVHTPNGGPGSLSHLPTGSSAACACGRVGCLEATVSDQATLAAATAAGVFTAGAEPTMAALHRSAQAGDKRAEAVLNERARVLGRTVALLRDLFNPDKVILGGQAFTDYPPAMRHFAAAFNEATTLPGKNVLITGFGSKVQEFAATAVALSVLHADPLPALRRVESA